MGSSGEGLHTTYINSRPSPPSSLQSKTSLSVPLFRHLCPFNSSVMNSNYLLQADYQEHRNGHSDYRHSYPSSFSPDDPQYWSYPYPAQSPHYARYAPSQCDPQPDPAPPFICEASSLPSDDFAASTRLGLFDISTMHPQVSSVEPWGSRNEGQHPVWFRFPCFSLLTTSIASSLKAVPFDEQAALAQSGFPPANSYYPIPAHSPPWVHPSPPSDTTPPSSNSPTSTLANYAGALASPSPITESLGKNPVIDARTQDVSEEASESAAQSPPVTTRNPQGTGRRPGACSRCKKLKV
jgi:hypothetical protein